MALSLRTALQHHQLYDYSILSADPASGNLPVTMKSIGRFALGVILAL